MQRVAPPISSVYSPAEHNTQADKDEDPTAEVDEPAGQAVQEVAPPKDHEPTGQSEHALTPTGP